MTDQTIQNNTQQYYHNTDKDSNNMSIDLTTAIIKPRSTELPVHNAAVLGKHFSISPRAE